MEYILVYFRKHTSVIANRLMFDEHIKRTHTSNKLNQRTMFLFLILFRKFFFSLSCSFSSRHFFSSSFFFSHTLTSTILAWFFYHVSVCWRFFFIWSLHHNDLQQKQEKRSSSRNYDKQQKRGKKTIGLIRLRVPTYLVR